MDPTAPGDNNQDPHGENDRGPIQTGGFVVSGESSQAPSPSPANPTPSAQNPQPVPPEPFAQDPTRSTPTPLASDLQSDLQSTVASATDANLAGTQDPAAPQPASSSSPDPINQLSQDSQPDPTPFVPPQAEQPGINASIPPPGPAINPVGNAQQPHDGIKTAKIKSAVIIIAIFLLVAILAGVAWYFILNKGSSESTTTVNTNPVELPTPAARNESGFGNIPTPTPEASESTDLNTVP